MVALIGVYFVILGLEPELPLLLLPPLPRLFFDFDFDLILLLDPPLLRPLAASPSSSAKNKMNTTTTNTVREHLILVVVHFLIR